MTSTRLKTLRSFIKGYHTLYDVGTDHAYLPILAVKDDHILRAYAVDNKEGPLESARVNIHAAGLSEKITPVLSDGINDLPIDADVLVMAGLGGNAIFEALDKKDYRQLKRFVLQPHTHPEKVRMLYTNGLKIVDETIVLEDHIPYIIIVMEKGTQKLTQKEVAFGPILLKMRPIAFINLLKEERDYLKDLIGDIPHEEARTRHEKRLEMIEEVLYERYEDQTIF